MVALCWMLDKKRPVEFFGFTGQNGFMLRGKVALYGENFTLISIRQKHFFGRLAGPNDTYYFNSTTLRGCLPGNLPSHGLEEKSPGVNRKCRSGGSVE